MSKTQVPIWFDEWLKSPSEIEKGSVEDKLLGIELILQGSLRISKHDINLSRREQLEYINAIINGYRIMADK